MAKYPFEILVDEYIEETFDELADLDDDEIESIKKIIEGEGYEAVMKDVAEVRQKSYEKFYEWYGKKTGKTVHEMNGELIMQVRLTQHPTKL